MAEGGETGWHFVDEKRGFGGGICGLKKGGTGEEEEERWEEGGIVGCKARGPGVVEWRTRKVICTQFAREVWKSGYAS